MAKNTSWKKLSEKLLLEHPRLTVYEDDVELPSGHKTSYIRIANNPNASCVIVVDASGKILLQKEYSYPPNQWLYQFPGGAFERGDTPTEAARRELAEEASLAGSLRLLGWYYADNRRKDAKYYVYVCTHIRADKNAQKDTVEEIEHYWFTEKEIDDMIRAGEIVHSFALAAWAFYKADRQSLLRVRKNPKPQE